MRISDWSSDVCSSDLQEAIGQRIDPVSGKILGRLPDVSQGGSDLRTTLSIDQQRGLAVPVLHREAQGSKDLRQQGKPPNALTAVDLDIGEGKLFVAQAPEVAPVLARPEDCANLAHDSRSEEHTSELQSIMTNS